MPRPYRADHVGSLLRPPELLAARDRFGRGTLSSEALREQEDAAILQALERQNQVGLEIFTDGEFRRGSWVTDMADAVAGFIPQSRTVNWRGPGGGPEPSTSSIVGAKLEPRRRLTGDQTAFLTKHSPGPVKMTLPAPSNFWVVSWKAGVSDKVYQSRSEMLEDVVRIVRDEIKALIDDGVEYIQMDAPFYGVFIDDQHRATLRQSGVDPDKALEEVVRADNAAIDGLARENVTLGLHICRGTSRSRWFSVGGYDSIAEQIFGTIGVDNFLLEYDAPEREGGLEPLRFLPARKTAVLGLVTSKEPGVESVEDLRRRIGEAAKFVPLEQLAISPQCGFASVAQGNLLSMDDQWRKLERIVQTAHLVWG
jgi:5-methyltetrahydropteroyltriglutamate--homocysteine methyltransferase